METTTADRTDESRYLTFARARMERLLSRRSLLTAVQPVVDMDTDDLVGHELLARPRASSHTVCTLLELAESQGLAAELSRELRRNGLAQTADRLIPGRLFLNTHPAELERPATFLSSLSDLVARYPQVELVVEIPERGALDLDAYVELRRQLHGMGLKVAFDEFGTGRSRLLELATAPPDYVKFSRSMIRGVDGHDGFRRRVLQRVLDFVASVGVQAIAVGVETTSQLEACRALGFHWAQGYLVGRPWTVAA